MKAKTNLEARQHGAMEFSTAPVDLNKVREYRLRRLRKKMEEHDVAGLLLFNQINTQDLGIVERVQEGLSNTAFTGGRMSLKFEEPLHRYQNWVADRMCGIHRVPQGDVEV